MQALIVSGGHLEDSFAAAYIREHSFDLTVAADSGMGFFARNGQIPDYIVGDFDSADSRALEYFSAVVAGDRNNLSGEPLSGRREGRGNNLSDKPLSGRQEEQEGAENNLSDKPLSRSLEGWEEAEGNLSGEPLSGRQEGREGTEGRKVPKILQFRPEKDETDTEIAIRTAIGKGCRTIHLLGATGTRVDHLLGNIHLLGMAMEQGVECLMVDSHNRIRMVQKNFVLKKEEQYGDYLSLLPVTAEVKGLTLRGLKYPLDHALLECYHTLGISNEIVGEQAEISFEAGILLVVESKD